MLQAMFLKDWNCKEGRQIQKNIAQSIYVPKERMGGLIEKTQGTHSPLLVCEGPRVACRYHRCELDNVIQGVVRCINNCKDDRCMCPELLLRAQRRLPRNQFY